MQCFIVRPRAPFKYWRLHIIAGGHNIGWKGSNKAPRPAAHRHAAAAAPREPRSLTASPASCNASLISPLPRFRYVSRKASYRQAHAQILVAVSWLTPSGLLRRCVCPADETASWRREVGLHRRAQPSQVGFTSVVRDFNRQAFQDA